MPAPAGADDESLHRQSAHHGSCTLRSSGGLAPALRSSVLEPLWAQVAALLPTRPDTHPLGCHRPRIPDRIVFDRLIQVLVFGCGYRRIADATCSATTPPRHRDEWIALGLAEQPRLAVLAALPAPANHRDDRLLAATLDAVAAVGPLPEQPVVHLDAGYDDQPCRQVLAERGMVGKVATRGMPAPIQLGRRWVIERTHAWGNQYGKLRWCTERRRIMVEFWLALAAAAIVCGRLVRRARTSYRWDADLAAAHDVYRRSL